jgi:ubiquinone/menaquinone biosynthesis C-methylase UbiE
MIENIFIFLTQVSPKIKRKLWRWWYEFLANSYQKSDWQFMNYGFADLNSELKPLNLTSEEEENRYFIQLYQYVTSATNLEGKKVLEVGSGRGGGASFMAKTFKPEQIIGVDFSEQNTQLANKLYNFPNLLYKQGDSENLPFDNDTFDVIINVESSHCYGSMTKFVQEVKRVLKLGGIFSWVDLRPAGELENLEKSFAKSGLKQIKKDNITSNVVKALELVNESKQDLININVPKFLRQAFQEFAGVKDSKIYNGFVNGEMIYLSYILEKEGN